MVRRECFLKQSGFNVFHPHKSTNQVLSDPPDEEVSEDLEEEPSMVGMVESGPDATIISCFGWIFQSVSFWFLPTVNPWYLDITLISSEQRGFNF